VTGLSKILRRTLRVAFLSLSVGCVHRIAPPPVPGPVQSPRFEAPIPPGLGRVYIDVVDGPTNVRSVRWVEVQKTFNGEVFDVDELETLQRCRTPCVLDMPLGQQLLAFPIRASYQVDVDDVSVSTTPSLYRRALGWRRSGGALAALGIVGVTLGGVSLATGAALLPIGLATDTSGMTTSGAITLGVGAVLTALGIWAVTENPSLVQPGAAAQYDLGP
jgi:hypothetical protein